MIEAAARTFHLHGGAAGTTDEGHLAGVWTLAGQAAGMHCDNKGGVNSLRHACAMLATRRVPLVVHHGQQDTSVHPSHAESIAKWAMEGHVPTTTVVRHPTDTHGVESVSSPETIAKIKEALVAAIGS